MRPPRCRRCSARSATWSGCWGAWRWGVGRWLAAYGACLALLGVMNLFALLLIAAHAVTVALAWWCGADRQAVRSMVLGWLAAAAAAAALVSPITVLAWAQRG